MDRLEPEVLKMIADALHDTVQCPVCLAPLRPPVTLCLSGHGLCPDCKPHINECPTCREAFIPTKPIIFHQLLEMLPRACQFKALGCTDVYILGGSHEEICSYRTVDCQLIECEWTGQSRKLQSHLTTSHAEPTIILQGDMRAEMSWQDFDTTQDSFKYVPIIAYDQVFWEYIHMNAEVKKLCISLTHSSNGNSNCEYFAIISFKNGNIGYTYTVKIPFVTNNMFVDFYEDNCMTIPGSMLSRFINDNSSLVYNIHLIKEDK